MDVVFISSIHQVRAEHWDPLWPGDHPFTRHAFLAALEDSGSTNSETGWEPCHALVKDNGKLIAVAPIFRKHHSWGEYVFDWSWADAYAHHGLSYYPKLVNAIPFTPSTGPRLALAYGLSNTVAHAVVRRLYEALGQRVVDEGGSGWHTLFPDAAGQTAFADLPVIHRYGYQYHWFNQGFHCFDDFLQRFSSRKRKNLKKERRKVVDAGLHLRMRSGAEVDNDEWELFYALYHHTYLKRSGSYGYLGPGFFQRLAHALPRQVLLASAHYGGEMVAGAFYLRGRHTLYGRYWGAREEFDSLHFEACYYQGIEYAIAHGLQRFDPGAQGEHKIQRGFTPIITCSGHWLAEPAFAHAVDDFCRRETHHVLSYVESARATLPFREGVQAEPATALLAPSWQ